MARAPSSESSSPERPTSTPAATSHHPPAAAGGTAAAAASRPTAVAATGGTAASGRATAYAVDSQPRTSRLAAGSVPPCHRDQAARYSSRLSTGRSAPQGSAGDVLGGEARPGGQQQHAHVDPLQREPSAHVPQQ